MLSIKCFPRGLDPTKKFYYTLLFILVPFPFFVYEFFTSNMYRNLVKQVM